MRTLGASQLSPRRLVACRPREQRSAGGCYSGDGAMAAAVAGKGEPKGRRTTGKVMPSLVRMEEGQSGGSSSGEELRSACPWRTRSGARVRHRGEGGGEQRGESECGRGTK